MNSFDELIDLINEDEIVLFIGAGISVNVGLPSWSRLCKQLASDIDYNWPEDEKYLTADHLLSTLQYYENEVGRHSLIRYVRNQLDTTGKIPSKIHQLLTLLPLNVVFTTNYDDLLERCYKNESNDVNVIVNEIELAYWNDHQVQIVKMCGDLSRPDSIVITKRDFSTYFETHERLAERLRTTLETKSALFLGYGLKDPFFNQIWDNITLRMTRHQRRSYAVLFDSNTLEVSDLNLRGINTFNIGAASSSREDALAEWLNDLINKIEPNKI